MPEVWPKQDRPARYYTLPLTLQSKLELSGPFPLTVEEWGRFKMLLDAMEPGLRDGYQPPVKPELPPDAGIAREPAKAAKPEPPKKPSAP